MPINYKNYPADWLNIRKRILSRANNKCEFCGLENHSFVYAIPVKIRTDAGVYKQISLWFKNIADINRNFPDKKIIGLSKLSRIVEYYSKRLNTQEYLTDNICNYLDEKLKPLGVGVVVNARHLCKEMRGVKKPGEMITCSLKGIFKDKLTTKNEFLNY